jgi:hypothetical protein
VIEDDQTPSASALPSSQAIIWSLHLSSHRDTIVACLDTTLRRISGVPTYALVEYVPRNILGLLCPAPLCGWQRSLGVLMLVNGWALPTTAT